MFERDFVMNFESSAEDGTAGHVKQYESHLGAEGPWSFPVSMPLTLCQTLHRTLTC